MSLLWVEDDLGFGSYWFGAGVFFVSAANLTDVCLTNYGAAVVLRFTTFGFGLYWAAEGPSTLSLSSWNRSSPILPICGAAVVLLSIALMLV